jgi:prefoldin subunit 5
VNTPTLEERVKALEDAVLLRPPGGPPGLAAQLDALEERIAELTETEAMDIQRLNAKIGELGEITDQLQQIVRQLAQQAAGGGMTAGA